MREGLLGVQVHLWMMLDFEREDVSEIFCRNDGR